MEHHRRRSLLTLLAIHAHNHVQVHGIGNLVCGHHPRPNRAERVGPLANQPVEIPIPCRLRRVTIHPGIKLAPRHIVEGEVPRHVLHGIGLGNAMSATTDHHPELTFIVGRNHGCPWNADRLAMPDDRCHRLAEDLWHQLFGRRRQATCTLGPVRHVVPGQRKHLARAQDWRTQAGTIGCHNPRRPSPGMGMRVVERHLCRVQALITRLKQCLQRPEDVRMRDMRRHTSLVQVNPRTRLRRIVGIHRRDQSVCPVCQRDGSQFHDRIPLSPSPRSGRGAKRIAISVTRERRAGIPSDHSARTPAAIPADQASPAPGLRCQRSGR